MKNEQGSAIKYCCWLKKSAADTVKLMHEAYTDEEQLGDSTIVDVCWYNEKVNTTSKGLYTFAWFVMWLQLSVLSRLRAVRLNS